MQAKAEGDAQSILITAKAQAAANKLLSESLSPQLVEMKKVEKWDGRLPQVTGGVTPMMDLRTKE